MIIPAEHYRDTIIQSFEPPLAWQSSGGGENEGLRYSPDGHPDVLFALFSRRVSTLSHMSLCRILGASEHVLSGSELELLGPVLGNMSDSDVFVVELAMILEHRHRRVLTVKGLYRVNGQRCRSLFLASSGNSVEQVYYQAPAGKFDQFEAEAESAFKSIKWLPLNSSQTRSV